EANPALGRAARRVELDAEAGQNACRAIVHAHGEVDHELAARLPKQGGECGLEAEHLGSLVDLRLGDGEWIERAGGGLRLGHGVLPRASEFGRGLSSRSITLTDEVRRDQRYGLKSRASAADGTDCANGACRLRTCLLGCRRHTHHLTCGGTDPLLRLRLRSAPLRDRDVGCARSTGCTTSPAFSPRTSPSISAPRTRWCS